MTDCARSFREITVLLLIGTFAPGIAPFSSAATGGHKPALSEIRVERLSGPLLSLDVASSSDMAVAALSDGRVRVWHLDTGEVVREFGFAEPETDARQKDDGDVEPIRVRFSPDGKALAVSYLSRIHFYQLSSWSETTTLGVEGEDVMRPLPQVRLSRRPLVEKQPDDLNTATRKWLERKTFGDGRTRITDFAFTPNGRAVVASYCRGSCYDKPTSTTLGNVSGRDPVRLWELGTGRIVWEYENSDRTPERVVMSPNGRVFATLSFQPGQWSLQLRALDTAQELWSEKFLLPIPYELPSIVFTADSLQFITLWKEPQPKWRVGDKPPKYKPWKIALFDATNGHVGAQFDGPEAHWIAISTDGLWLAATNWKGIAFSLYEIEKRRVVLRTVPRTVGFKVPLLDSILFSPDGRRIVASDKRKGFVFAYAVAD